MDGAAGCAGLCAAAGRVRAGGADQRPECHRNARRGDPHGAGSLDRDSGGDHSDGDASSRDSDADRDDTSRDAYLDRNASCGGISVGDADRDSASPVAYPYRDAPLSHTDEHARRAYADAYFNPDPDTRAHQHPAADQHSAARDYGLARRVLRQPEPERRAGPGPK